MKTIKLIALFILMSGIINAEILPECVVRLSKNDCSSCYNYLVCLKAINPLIKIRIVMNNTSLEDSADFFSSVVRIKEKYSIVFSDSIYQSLGNEVYSTISIISGSKVVSHFPLTQLPQNLKKINKFYFTDSLSLLSKLSSDYDRITITDKAIYLFRFTYSDITVISFKNLKKVKTYKMDERFCRVGYDLNFPEQPNKFDETKKIAELEGKNFNSSKILSYNIDNDTLFIFSKFFYPTDTILLGENIDARIRNKKLKYYIPFNVLFKVFNDSIIESYIVEQVNVKNTPTDTYGIMGTEFAINDSCLYINLGGLPRKKNNLFLGKWKLVENRWKFAQTAPLILPLMHRKENLGYDFTDIIIHWPNLIFQVTPEMYNIEKLKSNLLGDSRFPDLVTVPVKVNFYILDFIVKGNISKLVYCRNEIIYLGVFKNKKLVSERCLFILPQPRIPIVFEDENTIAYYSSEQNSLIRIRVK